MQLYWMYSSIVRLGGWFIVYFTKQYLEKEYDIFVIKRAVIECYKKLAMCLMNN